MISIFQLVKFGKKAALTWFNASCSKMFWSWFIPNP